MILRPAREEIAGILFVLCLLPTLFPSAIAAGTFGPDVSRSWFKPSLSVNTDPDVCLPLLNGYTGFFTSSESTNPLEADVYGNRKQTSSVDAITKQLRELPWKDLKTGREQLKIAEFQVGGKYYAVVRRDYSIGWRTGYSTPILITKPFAEYGLTEDNYEAHFDANWFGAFAAEADTGIFEALHTKDSRRRNYKSNVNGTLVNIYERDGSVYMSLSHSTDEQTQTDYLILKMLEENKFSLTCRLQTAPSTAEIQAQFDKFPAFAALRKDLSSMMGIEGSYCGTLHALTGAENQLRDALRNMAFRPWINRREPESTPPVPPDRRTAVDASLSVWGYSGVWNFFKYKSYLANLPRAEREIRDFYAANFSLSPEEAGELARSALSYALIAGFDHGTMLDEDHEVHRSVLEGTVSAAELENAAAASAKKDTAQSAERPDGADSLLTFALFHTKILSRLLELGLDPNKVNAFGKTPLMYAAQFNLLAATKTLLQHGAATEAATIQTDDSCNYPLQIKNVSALHYAVRYGSKSLIKTLVANGAPTYMQDSEGQTPYDYLTRFGGTMDGGSLTKESYGDANQNLTVEDRKELRASLLPPKPVSKKLMSRQETLKAERLYRGGKLQQSYFSLKNALSLDTTNERARSNMSLVALRLGKFGESAKASSKLIETASSDAEKANAYFNLGLVCRKMTSVGFSYDGARYCDAGIFPTSEKPQDRSALPNFLAAYRLRPTKDRLAAIVAFLQDVDAKNRKRVCRFPAHGSGIKSLYVAGNHLNFLVEASKSVPLNRVARRDGRKDTALRVDSNETIPLANGLKIERWLVEGAEGGSGVLVLDDKICSSVFPDALAAGTRLVVVFSYGPTSPSPTKIKLVQSISDSVVLVLYGNNISWTLEGSLSKTLGVYVMGTSTVRIPGSRGIPVFVHTTSVYRDPKGSKLGSIDGSIAGFSINAIVEVKGREFELTDRTIKENATKPSALAR